MKLFFSTRGDQNPVSAPEAVLRGIAPDGGLYIRNEMPRINVEEMQDASFCEIAQRILGDYLTGYSREEIAGCVKRQITAFGMPDETVFTEDGTVIVDIVYSSPLTLNVGI